MAYCAEQDIKDEITERVLIQLTDDENINQVNSSRVTDAIADADEEINSYLRKRYSVPLSPVPGSIKTASVVLTVYRLYLRRRNVPESIKDEMNRKVKWLDKVSKGEVSLGVQTLPAAAPEGGAEFTGPTRVFDRDSMESF